MLDEGVRMPDEGVRVLDIGHVLLLGTCFVELVVKLPFAREQLLAAHSKRNESRVFD